MIFLFTTGWGTIAFITITSLWECTLLATNCSITSYKYHLVLTTIYIFVVEIVGKL